MPSSDRRRVCRINVGLDAQLRDALQTIAGARGGAALSRTVFDILDRARPEILAHARALVAAERARAAQAEAEAAAIAALLGELDEAQRTVEAMRPKIFLPEQDIEILEIRRLVKKLKRDFETCRDGAREPR